MVFVPDAKNPVKQESPKEAENHIGPGVPGIQLHELFGVQAQILVQSEGGSSSDFCHFNRFGFDFHLQNLGV